MESVDYWDDSQYESMVEFYDSTNMVGDSIGIGAEAADEKIKASGGVVEAIMEDSGEGVTESIVEDSCDEMVAIVEDTFCDDWEMSSGAAKLEPLVNFRGVKSKVSDSRAKVIHGFDLNEPSAEEKELAKIEYKVERDFDLNKLPIAGVTVGEFQGNGAPFEKPPHSIHQYLNGSITPSACTIMNREEKRELLAKVTAVSDNLINDVGLIEHKVMQTDHDIERLEEIIDELHIQKENVEADDYQAFNIVYTLGDFMLHITGAVAKLEHKVAALKMALEAINEATTELNFAANKIPGIPLNE